MAKVTWSLRISSQQRGGGARGKAQPLCLPFPPALVQAGTGYLTALGQRTQQLVEQISSARLPARGS